MPTHVFFAWHSPEFHAFRTDLLTAGSERVVPVSRTSWWNPLFMVPRFLSLSTAQQYAYWSKTVAEWLEGLYQAHMSEPFGRRAWVASLPPMLFSCELAFDATLDYLWDDLYFSTKPDLWLIRDEIRDDLIHFSKQPVPPTS